MATPVIYQGDDTDFLGATALSVNLSTDFDLDGCTVVLFFAGCRREFSGLTGQSAVLPLAFSAKETGHMPVGTHKATICVTDAAGRKRTASDDVRIRVTDDLREAYGADGDSDVDVEIEMGVDPTRLMEGQTLRTNTPNGMRQAIKKIAQALGATVSVLAVAALPVFGASVQTAPLGELDLDQNPSVVTNVDLSGLLTAHQDISGKADKTDTYTKTETDAKIVELSPPTSLGPSTNYTDAALGAFAATGMVARATTYGTPTRWTDATGCVWEVGYSDWVIEYNDPAMAYYGVRLVKSGQGDGAYWIPYVGEAPSGEAKGYADSTEIVWLDEAIADFRATRTLLGTNLVGRVALTNDIPDVSGYATDLIRESTNAAVAVADAKISTNNSAFVSAVLAVPLTGADAGDLAELAEYGGYGTVGAALLALIAGLAAIKKRVTSAETALAQKANTTDLPYRLVEPGKWEFSDGGSHVVDGPIFDGEMFWYYIIDNSNTSQFFETEADALAALSLTFDSDPGITATRASLPGHLLDRAGNRVEVTGDTTLTLPAAVPGYLRDFLVRLEISGSTVPTITFAAPTGETITYETDGDEFPVPDEAGDWLCSFTENCVVNTFAVSLKKVNTVAQGGS